MSSIGPRDSDPRDASAPLETLGSPDEAEVSEGGTRRRKSRETTRTPIDAPPLTIYSADTRDLLGKLLDGRYLIEDVLGKGAMGLVLGARHVFLERRVAIKVLHPTLLMVDEMRERFMREARASSRLDHAGIVSVSDFGVTSESLHYLVMEYLEGEDLYAWTELRPKVPVDVAASIGAQIADALAAIHSQGYVHRDLKPENIWVMHAEDPNAPPQVKVLDLGIAAVIEGVGNESKRRLTQTGHTVGTVHYMSPEQALASDLDGRSDIYSLGCILWELATGECTFEGTSQMAVMMKHMSEKPQAPSTLDPAISGWFDAVVLRCLAKKPEERYQTAEEVRDALLAGIGGRRVAAPPTTSPRVPASPAPAQTNVTTAHPPVVAKPRRWPWIALLALVVAGALVAWRVGASGDGGVESAALGVPTVDGAGVAPVVGPPIDAPELVVDVGETEANAVPGVEVGSPVADEGSVGEIPAPGKSVTLKFDVKPDGSTIMRAGKPIGVTPLEVEVPRQDALVDYSFEHPRYVTLQLQVSHDAPQTVTKTLSPVRVRNGNGGSGRPSGGDKAGGPEARDGDKAGKPAGTNDGGGTPRPEGPGPSEMWRPAVPTSGGDK